MKTPTEQSRRDELATMVERGGEIPMYAWPGGYPMVYYPADAPGEDLCGECAEAERKEAEKGVEVVLYHPKTGNVVARHTLA